MPGPTRVAVTRRRPNRHPAAPLGRPTKGFRVGRVSPGTAGPAATPKARSGAAWPEAPYIPRYLVLPAVESDDQEGPIPVVGAHRFRVPPTPVLGASLSLMNLPAVATACRPFRTVAQRYHCARFLPEGAPPGTVLRTGRFPKV